MFKQKESSFVVESEEELELREYRKMYYPSYMQDFADIDRIDLGLVLKISVKSPQCTLIIVMVMQMVVVVTILGLGLVKG